jgi:hypothetical protein
VEELVRADVAVEDVALGQAVLAFQVQRGQHLPGDDGRRDVRRELADPGQHPVAELVPQDAPPEVTGEGFFAVIGYWISRTPRLIHEDWLPYRVTLIGNYCSSLQLRREITQYLLREDPYGTQAFVRFGIERGEVRTDIDVKMIVSLVDWLMDRCQDAIVTEELDPGLFGSAMQPAPARDLRVRQFVELLRGAVGARS